MFVIMAGKELIRKKMIPMICVLSLLFAALYTYGISVLNDTAVADQSLAEHYLNGLTMLYLGLFFSQLMLALFVFFAAMGAISGEIESGLLYAIVARPKPRWGIYLGKFAGFAVWSMGYAALLFWLMYAAVFWQTRINVEAGWLFKAFALFELIPLLLLALTMLGSTFLPTLGNGAASALLFCLGLFGGFVEGFVNLQVIHSGMEKFSLIISLLIPTDAVFRRMIYELTGSLQGLLERDLLNQLGPFGVATPPSMAFIGYALIYLLAVLGWGMWRFSRKDIM